MTVITFLIVLGFNIFWLSKYGIEYYKDSYNGSVNTWLSVGMWGYLVFGVVNLIFGIKNLIA